MHRQEDPLRSALFTGRVIHQRLAPRPHRLSYRVLYLLVDIDELDGIGRRLRLFAHNRPAAMSIHDRDHGPRDGSGLREHISGLCRAAGACGEIGSIQLLCMPRLFGCVFNPLSVYICRDPDGSLAALVYEVKNTFGDQHSYVFAGMAADPAGRVPEHECCKRMHVSPFMPLTGGYRFRLSLPAPGRPRLVLAIRHRADASNRMHAIFAGERRALTDSRIAAAIAANPALALKVTGGIGWHALRLWLKGLPFHPRPQPPDRAFTIAGTQPAAADSRCQRPGDGRRDAPHPGRPAA